MLKHESQFGKCEKHDKQTAKDYKNTTNMTKQRTNKLHKMTFLDFLGRLWIQPPAPDEKTTKKWQTHDKPNDKNMTHDVKNKYPTSNNPQSLLVRFL